MSVQGEKKSFPRVMIAVNHTEDEKKLDEALDALRIPVCCRCRGVGTAPSEIMDIFGMRGTGRIVTVCILPKCRVREAFDYLAGRLAYRKRGGGIAITVPVNGLQGSMLRFLNEEAQEIVKKRLEGDEAEMKKNSLYSLIWVSVARGYSDAAIDAARSAGARGGTVMKGKRRGSEQIMDYFGFPMQEEQEFVMIVASNEKKSEIMSAVTKACGLKTEARGMVVSIPVDDVMGLEG